MDAGRLLHTAFFLIAGASVLRMRQLDDPLCPYLITLNLLLAATYAIGLARWDRMRHRAGWLTGLLLTWLAMVIVTPAPARVTVAWCVVPLACLTVRILPPRTGLAVLAGITVALATTAFQPGGIVVDLAAAPIAVVWATAALYRGQLRDAELREHLIDQLRGTRAELARRQREAGVLSERARLAREIHDTLAQDLAAHRTLLQAADRDWTASPERARHRMRDVTASLGDDLTAVRRMIADLTPLELEDHDLGSALDALCERERARGTVADVAFRTVGEPRTLPPPETAALLRVAQSALANIREHAHARHVRVTLAHREDEVTLRVSDDGCGFAPDHAGTVPARGYGLAGMRQRLEAHGGELSVESTPGGGTVLTGRLPMTRFAVTG